MSTSHEHPGLKAYFGVISLLMALTALTVWAAFHDFGALNTPVALLIAFVKAFAVAAIFMHLRGSPRINWAFAGSGLIFLLLLIAFVVGDIKGRRIQYHAQPWENAPSQLVTAGVPQASGHP